MKPIRILNLLLVLVFVASLFISAPAARAQQSAPLGDFVPGELVVGLSQGADHTDFGAQASALADTVGAQVVKWDPSGAALLRFAQDADVSSMAAQVAAQAGVAFAEPNYIYRIPEPFSKSEHAQPPKYVLRESRDRKQKFAVPVETLQSMKTRKGPRLAATYPNDPFFWNSNAYAYTMAPIVWPNPTASKSVCEIDTGVDNLHPDLAGKIVLGKDFVNEDLVPMDDNGHGTHVAGIMVATPNNGKGLAGIAPNAKVVAVKALNAQGSGTNYDVSAAIRYCADRTDISVINMSLGGPYAQLLEQAVDYATNTKLKLLVAASGNDNRSSYCGYWFDGGTPNDPSDDYWVNQGDERLYPAGFTIPANNYDPNDCTLDLGTQKHPGYAGVVSVASSGDWQVYDCHGDGSFACAWYETWWKSPFSNYGPWVTFIAPGLDVFSTTPYDKPFDLLYQGVQSRYDWLSGTSMATPAASATFARGWGYLLVKAPGWASAPDLNIRVKNFVFDRSDPSGFFSNEWPPEQPEGTPQANVARVLERGAVDGAAVDATTGNAVPGLTLQVYQGTTLKGSAAGDKWGMGGGSVAEGWTVPASWAEIINLPGGNYPELNAVWVDSILYTPKVSIPNYTAVPVNAFVNSDSPYGEVLIDAGWWSYAGTAAVPPKSPNFAAVASWYSWDISDLDQVTLLPGLPKDPNDGQPGQFVAYDYYSGDYGKIGNIDPADNPPDGTGSLGVFPFVRHQRQSEATSNWDGRSSEATTLRNRFMALGAAFPANAALPFYTGTYGFWVSDWGQYYDLIYNQTEDPSEFPALHAFTTDYYDQHLSMFIWKDGLLKARVNRGDFNGSCGPGQHLWLAATLTSGASGTPSINPVDECQSFDEITYGDVDLFIHHPIQ